MCAQVLFRLNFLVLVLCVVMDRPYQFYYFVPLVTFWFVIIYATMALWPQVLQKRANGRFLTPTSPHRDSGFLWTSRFLEIGEKVHIGKIPYSGFR